MHFTCRSFLGHSEDFSWSQYWENEPDDPVIFKNRGHLFALVSLEAKSGDANSIGHQLIDDINHRYFSSLATPASVWLKDSLDLVISDPKYQSLTLSLLVAVVIDGRLCLSAYNFGHAILRRDSQISRILSATPDTVSAINGTLKDGDSLFLCTPAFLDQYTWDRVKSYLSLPLLKDIEESFLADLYTFEDQSSMAALLVEIHDDAVSTSPSVDIPEIPAPPVTPVSAPRVKKPFLIKSFLSKLTPRSVYVTHQDSARQHHRRRTNIILSLIILAILSLSIFAGFRRNTALRTETRYQELKTQYQDKISQARTVKNLNLSQAQQLASDSLKITESMLKLKIHQDEITAFSDEAREILSQTGSADSFTPQDFYDTTMIDAQARYQKIYLSKNMIYLLDPDLGRIDRLEISQKSQIKISDDPQLKGAVGLAENSGQIYILKDNQIYSVDRPGVTSAVNLTDSVPGFRTGSFNFWNGSLYVLADTDVGFGIWKFAPSASGFSPGTAWLKSGQALPSPVSSFAINGQIWVQSLSGKIVPYSLGTAGTFNAKTSTSLSAAANLITAANTDILAFTEGDSMVYVFRKDGETASGFNFGSRGILNLALDPQGPVVYVLCRDQKIYKIAL